MGFKGAHLLRASMLGNTMPAPSRAHFCCQNTTADKIWHLSPCVGRGRGRQRVPDANTQVHRLASRDHQLVARKLLCSKRQSTKHKLVRMHQHPGSHEPSHGHMPFHTRTHTQLQGKQGAAQANTHVCRHYKQRSV